MKLIVKLIEPEIKVNVKQEPVCAEQLRKTINFIKELTGKDFKQVKIKPSKVKNTVCSKMERSEHPEITPNYNQKYKMPAPEINCNWACPDGYCNKENNKVKNIEVKDEEFLNFPNLNDEDNDNIIRIPSVTGGGLFIDRENKYKIHGEGLRCRPDCVKKMIWDDNKPIFIKCNNCNPKEFNISTTKINSGEELKDIIIDSKKNNMYFGSASIIPNKAWIDENDN